MVIFRAHFETMEGKASDRKIIGDATDKGLLKFAATKLLNIDKVILFGILKKSIKKFDKIAVNNVSESIRGAIFIGNQNPSNSSP